MEQTIIKELAYRENDGVEVALFWQPAGDRLHVSVRDMKTGDVFQLRAEAGNALDVFHHPFAHAAVQRLESVEARLDRQPVAL